MQFETWCHLLVVSAIACAGCGSSGGGGNGGGGSGSGGSTSTGTDTTSGSGGGVDGIVVTIDGTEQHISVGAQCTPSATLDICAADTVVGAGPSSRGMAIYFAPQTGTFNCAAGQQTPSMNYNEVDGNGTPTAWATSGSGASCTVTVTKLANAAGERYEGTFSGTLVPLGPGATSPKVLTNGSFSILRTQ